MTRRLKKNEYQTSQAVIENIRESLVINVNSESKNYSSDSEHIKEDDLSGFKPMGETTVM